MNAALVIGVRDVLKTVGPQVVTALGAAAVAMLVRHTLLQDMAPLARLIVLGVLCGAVYLAVMTLGFRITRPLTVAISLVRTRKSGVE